MVQPRPRLGYAMVAIAATLFAVNGTVSKVILGSGISSGQLTAVRCAGALIGLALIAAATRSHLNVGLGLSLCDDLLVAATRVGITAMVEPVVAIIVAWVWLRESLQPVQAVRSGPYPAGIGLAQTSHEKAALSEPVLPLLGDATPERDPQTAANAN